MKKAFFVLLSQLMIFSISATTVETNTPDSVQDSLIKRFLRFVPDSMAIESVIISDYKDEEVEESWILITKAVGEDKETEDGNIYWNKENEYCIDFGERGIIVLFRYKGGEYYIAGENYHCLLNYAANFEDMPHISYLDERISLDESGVLDISYINGLYPDESWGCYFKYFNGEFKHIGHPSKSDYASNYFDFIVTESYLINGKETYNENGDYNDDFKGRYIHYTYKTDPTYLPNISNVDFYMGRTDVENPNLGNDILKIEVDDYKIVDGEKEWYRREITEEEAEEIKRKDAEDDDTQE